MIDTYVNSKKETILIKDMNTMHLINAINKIQSGSGKNAGTPAYQKLLLEALIKERDGREDYIPGPSERPKMTVTGQEKREDAKPDKTKPLNDDF